MVPTFILVGATAKVGDTIASVAMAEVDTVEDRKYINTDSRGGEGTT